MKQVLAIDIGRTNKVFALVNKDRKITFKRSLNTKGFNTAEDL
jgi:predicted NBD/HSP70 family sugar kinase